MLVNKDKTERLTIPHEEGEWIDIRNLTGVELDEASDAVVEKALKQFESSLEAIMSAKRDKSTSTNVDRKVSYDPAVVLRYGVVAWSYAEPVTRENIALLDGKTRDWLWEEVVNRNTVPPA